MYIIKLPNPQTNKASVAIKAPKINNTINVAKINKNTFFIYFSLSSLILLNFF